MTTDPGERAVTFINGLRHSTGKWAGQSFNLRPWQADIVRRTFGTIDPATGMRQYRTVFLFLPRKNGKSQICAAMALYNLFADNEPGAQIYSAAADRGQASLVYNAAVQMVQSSPALSQVCSIYAASKRILYKKTDSFYQALSAETFTKHGLNASCVIYDELHCAPSDELWDVLRQSMGTREQPLMIGITTAGISRHGLAHDLYQRAKNALENPETDPSYLPIIYEAAPDDAWDDETVWQKANPALGDFRSLEEMRISADEARLQPSKQTTFRRYYLNQWTDSAEGWLNMDQWDAGAEPSFTEESLHGRPCVAGLDLARVTDLTALVLVFPPDRQGDPVKVLCRFWCPLEKIRDRGLRDKVPYDRWVREGLMSATPGNATDFAYVARDIVALAGRFDIREVAYDRTFAGEMVQTLQDEGVTMVPFGQGFLSMGTPTAELERLVVSGELQHGGNPMLRWCASNTSVKHDPAGSIKPDKQRSIERIDGIVALIMGLGRMGAIDSKRSVYEDRGLIFLGD